MTSDFFWIFDHILNVSSGENFIFILENEAFYVIPCYSPPYQTYSFDSLQASLKVGCSTLIYFTKKEENMASKISLFVYII